MSKQVKIYYTSNNLQGNVNVRFVTNVSLKIFFSFFTHPPIYMLTKYLLHSYRMPGALPLLCS